jgi:hypothetical protein
VQWQTADTDEPALDTLSALPVYTKRSRIPGVRGDGAFAARDLLEGEVIGEYAGEIVRDAELAGARRVISDCHFAVQRDHFIPGFLSYSGAVFLK